MNKDSKSKPAQGTILEPEDEVRRIFGMVPLKIMLRERSSIRRDPSFVQSTLARQLIPFGPKEVRQFTRT